MLDQFQHREEELVQILRTMQKKNIKRSDAENYAHEVESYASQSESSSRGLNLDLYDSDKSSLVDIFGSETHGQVESNSTQKDSVGKIYGNSIYYMC